MHNVLCVQSMEVCEREKGGQLRTPHPPAPTYVRRGTHAHTVTDTPRPPTYSYTVCCRVSDPRDSQFRILARFWDSAQYICYMLRKAPTPHHAKFVHATGAEHR